MQQRILIVEDEPDLASTLEYTLDREGYRTRMAATGAEALAEARRDPIPDLILLDLMLPDLSGLEVCRRLRGDDATRGVAILMLTAKGEEIDRGVGFEGGADDYVVKPFSVRELVLRVAALLRRAGGEGPSTAVMTFGRLRLDGAAHRAWVGGTELALTALEFKLLAVLMERRGRVQTRDTLLTDVWGYVADVTSRTVDTHVKRLREKLGDAGAYVETVRGVGYRFRDAPDEAPR